MFCTLIANMFHIFCKINFSCVYFQDYILEVWRIPDVETKWNVSHRYSDFAQMHAALRVGTMAFPTLPPKKVFGNTDRDFINERRVALQVSDCIVL